MVALWESRLSVALAASEYQDEIYFSKISSSTRRSSADRLDVGRAERDPPGGLLGLVHVGQGARESL